MKFESNYTKLFISILICKYRLQNIAHFVQANTLTCWNYWICCVWYTNNAHRPVIICNESKYITGVFSWHWHEGYLNLILLVVSYDFTRKQRPVATLQQTYLPTCLPGPPRCNTPAVSLGDWPDETSGKRREAWFHWSAFARPGRRHISIQRSSSLVKIRQSQDRFTFMIIIPIMVRQYRYTETPPFNTEIRFSDSDSHC